MQHSEFNNPVFFEAVEAIDAGDIAKLKQLLKDNRHLVNQRLGVPEEGYFRHPYLLLFVANNPVRHKKLPLNIVEITQVIINALQKNHNKNYQHIIDYTLGLVCTGRIPKEYGVQIPLLELLISEGAKVTGSVLGAIGQHNFEAANYLLDKGAEYNLATAVALDQWNDVRTLAEKATASELYVALVAASFFGKADIISFLIDTGADVNGDGKPEEFNGFHSHASALHQAVSSGSLTAVKLLVKAGANLHLTDKIYGSTPLGWAKYMQAEEGEHASPKDNYRAIEEYLKQSGIAISL